MQKIKIRDMNFLGDLGSSKYHPPHHFEWDRTPLTSNDNLVVYTDLCSQFIKNSESSVYNTLWLLEPKVINPIVYQRAKHYSKWFDLVLSHDINFLNELPEGNGQFLPATMCWIKPEDIRCYEKECIFPLCSMVLSDKNFTEGHQLRHEIYNKFKARESDQNESIDFYGKGTKTPIDNKLISLKDYRFQIVIENSLVDYYFTEKLIDCLCTGVVPLYWGPPLDRFFNTKGIIQWKSVYQLEGILHSLSEGLYESMSEAVEQNFELAQKYLNQEDLIYTILREKGLI